VLWVIRNRTPIKVKHWPSKMLVAAKRAGGPARRPTNVALVRASISLCLIFQLIQWIAILSNVYSQTYDGMAPQHAILGENLEASERQTENARGWYEESWYEESLLPDEKLEERLKAHESQKRDLKKKLASAMKELGAPQELLRSSAKDEPTATKRQKRKRKRKKMLGKMDCEGFPEWPLSQENTLYNDQVGSPQCRLADSSYRWILHQTSEPRRRPSVEEVETSLSNLPNGTGYEWHSDEDICDFMRTQPLRFQALYNHLDYTTHKTDLWRYLLLHERGGIYLDDDAYLEVKFNSSFISSIDSVYVTQGNSPKAMGTENNDKSSPFGFTIFNGFLISKPCNRVLLSVAESMVHIGKLHMTKELRTWENEIEHPHLLNWYNLKLLANSIAERAPKELLPDPKCKAGTSKCTFFGRDTGYKAPFGNGTDVIVYTDDHEWTTAVFDVGKRPVEQVAGGKHDAVAPKNPHPSPWFPASYFSNYQLELIQQGHQ